MKNLIYIFILIMVLQLSSLAKAEKTECSSLFLDRSLSIQAQALRFFPAMQILNPRLTQKEALGMLSLRLIGSDSTQVFLRGLSKYDNRKNTIHFEMVRGHLGFRSFLVVDLGIEKIIKVEKAQELIEEIRGELEHLSNLRIFMNTQTNAFTTSENPRELIVSNRGLSLKKSDNPIVLNGYTSKIWISLDEIDPKEAQEIAQVLKRIINKRVMRSLPIVII